MNAAARTDNGILLAHACESSRDFVVGQDVAIFRHFRAPLKWAKMWPYLGTAPLFSKFADYAF